MKNKFEYILFRFIILLTHLFPKKKLHKPALYLSRFIYRFVPIRKNIVLQNLKTAFPEKDASEIEYLCKQNYYSFVYTLLEILVVKRMKRDFVASQLRSSNYEEVQKKIKEKNGLVFLTAHYGNWEFGAISVGININRSINVVVKPQRNPYVTKWLNDMRETFGNKVIPLGMSIRKVYSVLKNNELLGVVGDQRGPKEGMRVKFFGKDTAVYQGSVELALKTNTPIFTIFVTRNKSGSYYGEFEELKTDDLPADNDAKVKELMQRYMNRLENVVRKNPEQWFWMHKIWKY